MSTTAHFYAGDSDKLWSTPNGGGVGVHTDTPNDGESVAVWQDEQTTATRDVVAYRLSDSTKPTLAGGVMLLNSVFFNGSASYGYELKTNNLLAPVLATSVFGASAKTTIIAFRTNAAATNNATIYQNTTLFGENAGYFSIVLKTNGAINTIHAYNWDGNVDATTGIELDFNTDYIVMFRHNGTTLNMSLISGNGGVTRVNDSVSSGATSIMTGIIQIGTDYQNNSTRYFPGYIGEIYCDNTDLGATNSTLTQIINRWLPPVPVKMSKGRMSLRHFTRTTPA